MSRLPTSQRYKRHTQRWKRYEKQQPGHRAQIDVKFLEQLKGSRKRHYQFTAIDDCTRLRALKIYDRCNQKTAIQFVDYVLQKFPFRVEVIQTDNGSEFQQSFHWHVLDHGIQHVYIQLSAAQRQGGLLTEHLPVERLLLGQYHPRGDETRPTVWRRNVKDLSQWCLEDPSLRRWR